MDARELTKYVWKLDNEILNLKKEIEFLTNENAILRRKINDFEIDIKMIENMRR